MYLYLLHHQPNTTIQYNTYVHKKICIQIYTLNALHIFFVIKCDLYRWPTALIPITSNTRRFLFTSSLSERFSDTQCPRYLNLETYITLHRSNRKFLIFRVPEQRSSLWYTNQQNQTKTHIEKPISQIGPT